MDSQPSPNQIYPTANKPPQLHPHPQFKNIAQLLLFNWRRCNCQKFRHQLNYQHILNNNLKLQFGVQLNCDIMNGFNIQQQHQLQLIIAEEILLQMQNYFNQFGFLRMFTKPPQFVEIDSNYHAIYLFICQNRNDTRSNLRQFVQQGGLHMKVRIPINQYYRPSIDIYLNLPGPRVQTYQILNADDGHENPQNIIPLLIVRFQAGCIWEVMGKLYFLDDYLQSMGGSIKILWYREENEVEVKA